MEKAFTMSRIRDMEETERPYEKLERFGAKNLSDSELLAIILRNGTKEESSVYTARRVLSYKNSGLTGIHTLTFDDLQSIKGIGRVKSIQLKAVAEIATRIAKSNGLNRYQIGSPSSIANIYMEEMRYLEKEHIKVVFLDTKNGIISDKDIAVGTVNTSLVDPREVYKEALNQRAVHIILLHNHPSGDATPSRDDIEVTRRILSAGKVIGINLIDHIVIGDGKYTSIREKGLGGFD